MTKTKKTQPCSYCGRPAPLSGCRPCLAQGIDVPALTRDSLRRLTRPERLLTHEAASAEGLDQAELLLLSLYLRGPRTCGRFDGLPEVVQCAARRVERSQPEQAQ